MFGLSQDVYKRQVVMNRMDLNSTHSCDFSYHNITRSQISIDKYNGESKRINIPEKISEQEVVEIGEKAFSNNLIIEKCIDYC